MYNPIISNMFGEILLLCKDLKHVCNFTVILKSISLYYGKWTCNDACCGLIKLTYVKWTWTLIPSFHPS